MRYLVTIFDDSQAQDREDSYFDRVIHASDKDEAERLALIDEPVSAYVTAIRALPAVQS